MLSWIAEYPRNVCNLLFYFIFPEQASLSEIHSNMWVRNGLQIKGQAMTYVQSHFCNSMIDPDIYLLQVSYVSWEAKPMLVYKLTTESNGFILFPQVCASRLDPDYFISSVFER